MASETMVFFCHTEGCGATATNHRFRDGGVEFFCDEHKPKRRWKVDVIYTVYVEHDDADDVVAIATDWLDEEFAHGLERRVTPVVGDVQPLGGWARDTSEATR